MSAYALLEATLIAAALLASIWIAWGALLPNSRRAVLARLGVKAGTRKSAGCGSGCSSCDGCAPTGAKTSEQPVRFDRGSRASDPQTDRMR